MIHLPSIRFIKELIQCSVLNKFDESIQELLELFSECLIFRPPNRA